MASPFTVFRKNQKVMMAAVTILAMFGFVILGPRGCGTDPRTGGSVKGSEVATWKFGTITMNDLANRVATRKMLNVFIGAAEKEAYAKGGFADNKPRFPEFSESKRDSLESILLNKKAEQLKVTVSDDTVNQFINNYIADNKLSGAELNGLIRNMSNNVRITPEQLIDAFRFELQSYFMRILLSDYDTATATPEQRFDYFTRVNRKATIQVLPVEVKDFVSKVAAPSDAELRAFFEQYKDQFVVPYSNQLGYPNSADPGFKQPVRVKLQYFQVKLDDLIKAEKPKVTDEEINKYYADHKDFYKKTGDSSADTGDKAKKSDQPATGDSAKKPDQSTEKPATTPETGSDKPATDKTDKTQPPAPSTDKAAPTDKAPATDKAPPAEKTPPDGKPPAADKSAPVDKQPPKGDSSTTEPKPDSQPEDAGKAESPKPDADSKAPPANKSALIPGSRRGAEFLLALADDAKAPADAPKSADNKPADAKAADAKAADVKAPEGSRDNKGAEPPKAADPTAPEPKPADNKPTDNKPADTKPADAAAEKTTNKTPPVVPPVSGDAGKTAPAATGNPELDLNKPFDPTKKIPIVEYKSLDDPKVREEIREDVASEKVSKKIDDTFTALRTSVIKFANQFSSWNAKKEGTQPVPPDFKAMAKEKGIDFQETGWVSFQDELDTDFGKSIFFTGDNRNARALGLAFSEDIRRYNPSESYLFGAEMKFLPQMKFLWWRTDYKDAYVPRFEDVKKEVLDTWKMVHARELAVAQANKYADEIKKQQAELQEVFKFRPELHPSKDIGPFMWITQPSIARDPSQPTPLPYITPLDGVEKPGEEFMRTVFALGAGNTGVAMNSPQTVAYVIQVKGYEGSESSFRQSFLRGVLNPHDASNDVVGVEASLLTRAKYDAIRTEFEFKPLVDLSKLDKNERVAGGPAPAAPTPDDSGPDF